MSALSKHDLTRYDRQLMIPEIGIAGQETLKRARVVLVGAGGLGSSAATYLAAAGIGRLTIIDYDLVDPSNLNRQTLHWEKDIARKKVDSAIEKLKAMNADIQLTGIHEKILNKNASDLIKDHDAVVDCLDNFETRFVVNHAAMKLHIPFFHGACHGFEGRLSTMIPGKSPCLRCLFPQCPPAETVPVIGVTPGIIGAMQAAEVIKYILGLKPLLLGRLLIYDSVQLTYDLIEIKRNPNCPSCAKE